MAEAFATSAMVHIAVQAEQAEHTTRKDAVAATANKGRLRGVSVERLARWEAEGRITAAEAVAARAFLSRALEVKAARIRRDRRERAAQRHAAAEAANTEAAVQAAAEDTLARRRRERSDSAYQSAVAASEAKRRYLADLHKISRRALVVHSRSDHYFDWTKDGFSKQGILDDDTEHPDHPANLRRGLGCCGTRWFACRWCCCVTRTSHPVDMYVSRFHGGFGPDVPPIHRKEIRGASTLLNAGGSNALYRFVIWIGYASGALLATYGVFGIAVVTLVFTVIYAEFDCVVPVEPLGSGGDGGGGAESSALTITLIALTQIVGGGTAPGTVRTDSATCALASVAMSTINVGIRALLFAAGLAALTDVESEVEFTSKICIASRDGVPTLLARFAFPTSVHASLSHTYGELTLFVTTKEGKRMSQHFKVPMKSYPYCKIPVTASHVISRSSPLFKYIKMDKDGLILPVKDLPSGFFTLHVIAYDTTTERYSRRFRSWDLKSFLYNQRFQDLLELNVTGAVMRFATPVILLENMQRTVLLQHAVDRLNVDTRIDPKEDEDEDSTLHKKELKVMWRDVIGGNAVDIDVLDREVGGHAAIPEKVTSDIAVHSPIPMAHVHEPGNTLGTALSTIIPVDQSDDAAGGAVAGTLSLNVFKVQAHSRRQSSFQVAQTLRTKCSMDPDTVYIFELESKELYLVGLSDLEAESLASFIDKALRPLSFPQKTTTSGHSGESKVAAMTKERTETENGKTTGENPKRKARLSVLECTHMYEYMDSGAWDRSAALQAEVAWKKERDAQPRFPTCAACICKVWSGRVCQSRAEWSLSYHISQGFRGVLPEWQLENFHGKNPLYTLRKCFHLGCMSSMFGSFLVIALALSTALALSYQAGDCFLLAETTSPSTSSFANASISTTPGTEPPFVTFGQALSSAIVQVGTGSPADPLRQHLSHCALLIMFAAAANVVMRVIVFSAFLHAVEKAKPEVVFTEKIVCNVREGVPVLQIRALAPAAHSLQIQSCAWRLSFAHTTVEGQHQYKHAAVKSHSPAFMALPMTSTHKMDHDCPIYQHFAATGEMPTNINVIISLAIWDVAKCRYFEQSRTYSLDRDIAVGFEFEDTLEVSLIAAARDNKKPTINLNTFNTLRSVTFRAASMADDSPDACAPRAGTKVRSSMKGSSQAAVAEVPRC